MNKYTPLSIVLMHLFLAGCSGDEGGSESMELKFNSDSNVVIYESADHFLQAPPEVTERLILDLREAKASVLNYEEPDIRLAGYEIVLDEYKFPIYSISVVDFLDLRVSNTVKYRYQHHNLANFRALMLAAIRHEEGFGSPEVQVLLQKYVEGGVSNNVGQGKEKGKKKGRESN